MLEMLGDTISMQVAGSLGFGGELSGLGRYLMGQHVTALSDQVLVE